MGRYVHRYSVHITNRLFQYTVIRLSPDEIENVRFFAESNHLRERKRVILFECSPKSGQSFVTLDFARAVSKNLIEKNPDISIIISTNEPVDSTNRRIIDGSVLTFRENASLQSIAHYSLVVSGISWLCTSDSAERFLMVQLLKKETCMYASFVCDHTYHGLSTDSIIEMTECSVNTLSQCIEDILNENFGIAHQKYHEKIGVSFKYYADVMAPLLFQKGKSRDLFSSLKCMIKKYGFHIQASPVVP